MINDVPFHKWLLVVVELFRHNIKIAFRNMLKYKSQTFINILGLATGLTCFALSTLWIRYETSFDSSHKNAKQLYVIYTPTSWSPNGNIGNFFSIPYAAYLKENFAEIANATPIITHSPTTGKSIILEGVEIPSKIIAVDSNFINMFDLKILEGSRDFLNPSSGSMAITREKARQLFGNNNPIGKRITTNGETYTIGAVISGMPKPSNYQFDFIMPFYEYLIELPRSWNFTSANIIIELFPGTDIHAFEKKLKEHLPLIDYAHAPRMSGMFPLPLNKMRYTDPFIERDVKIQDIFIFSISGLIIVLCSLFNYFISLTHRFHIRQKELALRMVFGASGFSLHAMLTVEFLLTLFIAVVLGILLTQLFYEPFLMISKIQMDLSSIYRESFMYLGIFIPVSLLFIGLILYIFRSKNLNYSIRRGNKKLFGKISIVTQLVISMVFFFCTGIIQKQMFFLRHSREMGFSIQNRGLIMDVPRELREVLVNRLKQIPEITEVIDMNGMSVIFPGNGNRFGFVESSMAERPDGGENLVQVYSVSPELIDFYELKLSAGEMLTASDPESFVLISEETAKMYGWNDPVGQRLFNGKYIVKGMVKNVYSYGPTLQNQPAAYSLEKRPSRNASVLFKYREGMWKSCKEKIEQLMEAVEYADMKRINTLLNLDTICNFEEQYNKFLKSEIALYKLFSFFSTICILICIFGFVSLVSLTCKERRKSIAIRKINGATSGDILVNFAKEYAVLLMIGSVIAFFTGYFFMQSWLEHYVIRTGIPAWIYLFIFSVMALVIVFCVGHQVYKASIERPSEVIKTE